MLHDLVKFWFHLVQDWGYTGVFFLMAAESSIIPVPSEVVMPPAAFWAAQGKMSFWGVVLAGTLGSWFGSAVSYYVAQWIGLPLLHRYGKYVLLPEAKLKMAERWVSQYGVPGIFIARLLPVVRHLISMPAGVFRMNFLKFSIVTTIGAGIWCWVLAWFGKEVIGAHPELLNSPDEMVHAIKDKLMWFVGFVLVFAVLYAIVVVMKSRAKGAPAPDPTQG
ncbi:MAG: DedA family protein [Phycisphaerae bacterium]|nr:DedA family protein [Phycisphaerae bacterium]